MSSRTVRILCLLVLTLQALTALASSQGMVLCTHPNDGTAHVDDHGVEGCCGSNDQPRPAAGVSCRCEDVPLGNDDPKPAVPRTPAHFAAEIDWARVRPFVTAASGTPAGRRAGDLSAVPNPPQAVLAGIVLLT